VNDVVATVLRECLQLRDVAVVLLVEDRQRRLCVAVVAAAQNQREERENMDGSSLHFEKMN
jgi:hypothetical protein